MSCSTDDLLAKMRVEFSLDSIQFEEIEYGGIIPVFFIGIKSEDDLANKWQDIITFIAVNYQSNLDDEYSIWNIYVFFLLKEEISSSLKSLIENDTFSSRKIIIEQQEDIQFIVKNHIKNDDLCENAVNGVIATEEIKRNKIISEVLEAFDSKKKITDDYKSALSIIEEKLHLNKL